MLAETFPATQGLILKFWEIVSMFNESSEEIVADRRFVKVEILTAFPPPRPRVALLLPNPEALDAPMPSNIEPTALAAFIC